MSFTTITSGLDWQDVDFVNEFIGAYNERRQAVGVAAIDEVEAGDDIQAVTFWRQMQDWIMDQIEGFDEQWYNHDATWTSAMDSLPLFNLSSFYSVAGLGSGFRRATEWNPPTEPTWSYGRMQAGDIIGPWIFEDLQKAFDTMRWTRRESSVIEQYYREGNKEYDEGAEEDRQTAIDDFDAMSWTSGSYPGSGSQGESCLFDVAARKIGEFTIWHTRRQKGKLTITGIPVHRDHEAVLYAKALNSFYYGGGTFEDIDTLGVSNAQFFLIQSFTAASVSSRTTDEFLPSDECPLETMPLIPSDDGGHYGMTLTTGSIDTSPVVLKWDFAWTL